MLGAPIHVLSELSVIRSFRTFLLAAALVTAGSSLVQAQPAKTAGDDPVVAR